MSSGGIGSAGRSYLRNGGALPGAGTPRYSTQNIAQVAAVRCEGKRNARHTLFDWAGVSFNSWGQSELQFSK
jgi:hypothetical protein